jgi:hypothetical protein
MPKYTVTAQRGLRYQGELIAKGDSVTIPKGDGEVLERAGRVKKESTATTSGGTAAATATKADATK